MITINKGVSEDITLLLRDKCQGIPLQYYFKFTNDVTKEEIILELNDTSDFPLRYSKFTITDTDFNTSTIGFWTYSVSIDDVLEPIAVGRMQLIEGNLADTDIIRYEEYNGSYKTYTI